MASGGCLGMHDNTLIVHGNGKARRQFPDRWRSKSREKYIVFLCSGLAPDLSICYSARHE